MKRFVAAIGLLLIDLGLFAGTSAFLPRRGSWGHSGPWSYFVNSRDRWDIAWGAFVAVIFLSVGAFLLLEAFGAFDRRPERVDKKGADQPAAADSKGE